MRADIETLMQGDLGTWLSGQNNRRAAAKNTAQNRWIWAFAALMPALGFLWFGPPWDFTIKAVISAVAAIFAYGWGYSAIKAVEKDLKAQINAAIAEQMGLKFSAEAAPGLEFELAEKFHLLPPHDRAKFEDCWSGALGGQDFKLYEARLKKRKSRGNRRRSVTVFKGVIASINCGGGPGATTLIARDGKARTLGLGPEKASIKRDGLRLDRVDQVHPVFEDAFSVYSTDQVAARVLLDPAFIEDIIALESAFAGDAMQVLYRAGQAIITLRSENLFESGGMDATNDAARIARTTDQINALAKLAMTLGRADGRGAPAAQEAPRPRFGNRGLGNEGSAPAVTPAELPPAPGNARRAAGFGRKQA